MIDNFNDNQEFLQGHIKIQSRIGEIPVDKRNACPIMKT